MYEQFYSSHWFKKNQIFSVFPIVKMKPNHAEIRRVGNLEPIFNKFPMFIFSEIFIILTQNVDNSNSAKKSKKYFLRLKFQRLTLL